MITTRLRFGFRGKNESCLFRLWKEYWENDEVIHAETLFVIRGSRGY
jgi:hypothetical protein